jgi:hypothetical protein
MVSGVAEGGDFRDENCLPALNLIRSTKLHATTFNHFLKGGVSLLAFIFYLCIF